MSEIIDLTPTRAAFMFAYENFKLMETIDSTLNPGVSFAGYVTRFREWMVIQLTVSTTNPGTQSIRMIKGKGDRNGDATSFETNWANRETLTYLKLYDAWID